MARLHKHQLADILPSLPAATPIDSQDVKGAPPDDLFLCALGFEERCLTLPAFLAENGGRARRVVYFKYSTNLDDNEINLPSLEGHLRTLGGDVEAVDADALDFPSRLRSLLDRVMGEDRPAPPRVTLDISVAANRLLLRCIQVLLEYDVSVRIVYAEAAVYHPTREEFESDPKSWAKDEHLGLERGVGDVLPSIDHPGHALDPLPDFLILFPCFKAERSKAVISFVDPSLLTNPDDKVAWMLGIPHEDADRWRIEAMRQINAIQEAARLHEVCTFDYRESLCALERLHGDLSERYRLTLSPLGSKMQALGTALFCYMHPDVRVVFSTPEEYNAARYSQGHKGMWKIDFGRLVALRRHLDSVGTLRIED